MRGNKIQIKQCNNQLVFNVIKNETKSQLTEGLL